MAKVNLDALIAREDFEVEEVINSGKKKETISIEDIKEDSFFFSNLRKPDFQRETNEWDGEKVAELIRSFISGDLIPAIILWRSAGGYLFIIDGSHRLSALAAWVNNDYGDGTASKLFYDGIVPEEQLQIAQETRKLVERAVGPYSDFRLALTHPDKVRPEIVSYAKNLGALAIQLQWVEGDARKAENSFFKINQQAAPIDKTELKLLEDRRKPNSIAARAIIRSGKGHKYWSLFPPEARTAIQDLAAEVNDILFNPRLQTPIKTLDLPVAGKLYSAQTLPLIVDMINIVSRETQKDDDTNGESTIAVLKNVRKISYLLNGNHPSSLGLHPAVYFYSQEGRHKNASFLATTDFVARLSERGKINDFIGVRQRFESFILEFDYLVQQINRKYRTAQASHPHISRFFDHVIDALKLGLQDTDILAKIQSTDEFGYLSLQKPTIKRGVPGKKFNSEAKSEVYLREVLKTAPRCKICLGHIHRNSISIDHIEHRRDGGSSSPENGQLSHPYCNTGYKN
ncbi:conserved hypothetical protein [Cupriavidus phytorum]|uniref:HNH nuclease domain-containing protein n=1 Tax=Cupriavidus taiwanensis TaxID=164546 RepID=A0A975X8F5_9BURK|nr:DUF262 domain-containing protein [Cupriavidus taiwanensis]SOY62194.1 conserved hypothetical protein [Cupriavidus taiwanensis]